jgi:hypothetical protein
MSTLEISTLLVTVCGLIPLYVDLLLRIRERNKIDFKLLRYQEFYDKPATATWGIKILHPNKSIDRCSVSYDSEKLPWWDNPNQPYYERFIDAMSGGNVLVPRGKEKDDAVVVVRDGKRIIRKKRFRDLPIV